jgi:hypothetical protein
MAELHVKMLLLLTIYPSSHQVAGGFEDSRTAGVADRRRILRISRPQEIFQPPQQGLFSVQAQLPLLGNFFQLSVLCGHISGFFTYA